MTEVVTCADCGAPMKLRPSRFGLFYGCTRWPQCEGTHGAHPDGRPLGIPATKEVKLARMAAHDSFDSLWRARQWHREGAYHWLAKKLGLSRDDCHIGMFNATDCQRVISICNSSSRAPKPAKVKP